MLKFFRKYWQIILGTIAGTALVVGANIAWPHSSDDPYVNWPTQAATSGMHPELFPNGQVPHPNLMVIFTCTPEGMRVDRRFLVDTDRKPYNYVDVREASYTGKGLCLATTRWQKQAPAYVGNFSSELKPEASWSELGAGWSSLPGDDHAFVGQGQVQVTLLEVHDTGLALGEPLKVSENGIPVPPHP